MTEVSIERLSAAALSPPGDAYGASGRLAAAVRGRWSAAAAAFWREVHHELRRHAGDEGLPNDLRARLREAARRSLRRSMRGTEAASGRFPRLLLRDADRVRVRADLETQARVALARAGVDLERPFVTLDVRSRVEAFHEALDYLRSRGYAVVRIGDGSAGPLRRSGVLDLAGATLAPAADVVLLLACRFLVCETLELQRAAYLTHTPTLMLNAPDAFSGYPVRGDGIYTLRGVVDLDTGRILAPGDFLGETFFRNLRNCGYRYNSPSEIVAAVEELDSALQRGSAESDTQSRFRERVIEAGAALADRVRHVTAWGPEDGFIGHGRLARVQADRA